MVSFRGQFHAIDRHDRKCMFNLFVKILSRSENYAIGLTVFQENKEIKKCKDAKLSV